MERYENIENLVFPKKRNKVNTGDKIMEMYRRKVRISSQRILIFHRRILYVSYKNTRIYIMRFFNKAWWKIVMAMSGAAARTGSYKEKERRKSIIEKV